MTSGHTFEAWLVLPGGPAAHAGDSASVFVSTPSRAEIWVRNEGETCDAADRSRRTWSNALRADTLVYGCLRAASPTQVSVVARVDRFAGGRLIESVTVPSALVDVRSRLDFGPGYLAVLTAALGFMTGLLAHVIQEWWTRLIDSRRQVEQAELTVLKFLAPELRTNHDRVAALVASTDPTKKGELLLIGGFTALNDDAGLLAYLSESRRKKYLGGLTGVYRTIRRYNSFTRQSRVADARAEAERLLPVLAGYMGRAKDG